MEMFDYQWLHTRQVKLQNPLSCLPGSGAGEHDHDREDVETNEVPCHTTELHSSHFQILTAAQGRVKSLKEVMRSQHCGNLFCSQKKRQTHLVKTLYRN